MHTGNANPRNNSEEPRPQRVDRHQANTNRDQSRVDGRRDQNPKLTPMDAWANHEWKKCLARTADGRAAATWNTPWEMSPLTLYKNLSKHQTTALMLLRTEVIGLNAWLASIHVPDILPRCDCGWRAQTVRHVLLHCLFWQNTSSRERTSSELRARKISELSLRM